MKIPRCLKHPWKFRKPEKARVNTKEDYVQTPRSRSGPPPKTMNLSDTGVANSHTVIPANAESEYLQHRSGDSDESKVGNSQETVDASKKLDQTQHHSSNLKVSAVGNPHEKIPAFAELRLSSAEGAAPGLSKSIELDEEATVDVKPRRDLWKEAHEKLSQHKQDLLSKIEKVEGSKVVKQVVQQAVKKYAEHEKGPWKTAFESSLKSILDFKEVISSAVSCDPTGHAAAAWTVVSLGLQMTQNELDRRQNVLKACGLLAGNLELMAAFEASYRVQHVQDSNHLEDSIVMVYRAILELSAEVVHTNTIGQKILSSFTKLANSSLQEFTKALSEAQEELRKWADIVKQEYHIELMNNVDSMLAEIEQMAQQVLEINDRTLTQEENSILDWLSMYPFDTYRATEEQRESGTGEWILDSLEYKAWKKLDDKVIWLYGSSGCGKSFLCSRIIDDLKSLRESEPSHVLAYWVFPDNNRDSLNSDNLLYSPLRQLCGGAKHIPNSVREFWSRNFGPGTRPAGKPVEDILDSVVIGLQRTGLEVLIVLDGLDEYPVKAMRGLSGARTVLGREAVLEWLHRFSENHGNVRVLVASRKEDDIRKSLGDFETLDVANEITEDVDLFIESCIKRIIEDGKWKAEFENVMRKKMKGASEKRFRWVYLVEQRFLGCNTREILQKALTDLPEEVVDIYAQVLNDIPKDDKGTARLILIWLTYSVRPLTLEELASAVSIPSPQKVLDICTSSLVSSQPEYQGSDTEVVKFDHFSVKEYLTSEKFRTSPETAFFYESPLIAHLTLAEISVSRFININNFNLAIGKSTGAKLVEGLEAESWPPGKDPLLSYSCLWYKHIQQADAIDRSNAQSAETHQISSVSRVQSHRLFCEEYSQGFQNWYQLIQREFKYLNGVNLRQFGEATSPIIIASVAGLPNNVRRLLDNGADVDEEVGNVNSNPKSAPDSEIKITRPIHAAAIIGNLEILGLLLKKGATLNQSDLDMIADENVGQGADVLNDILKARPSLKITEDTVMASARNWRSKEILSYILDHENHFTQPQLVAVAKNYETRGQIHDTIGKIIDYGERIDCDRNEILIAFLRWSNCGPGIGIVLDRYQPPNSMVNLALQSVFENAGGGAEMLPSVYEYYRDVGIDIHISPVMLQEERIFDANFRMLRSIVNHAKTVVVGIDTLQALRNISNGMILVNLFMNHEDCEEKYHHGLFSIMIRLRRFERHLRTCPVKVTKKKMQSAAQLDETALEHLRKNARPNVIFPSVDEIKDLVEKRRSGTQQPTETTLAQTPSSEPATVPHSEDS